MNSSTNVGRILCLADDEKIHLFFHALVSYNLGLLISGIYNCRHLESICLEYTRELLEILVAGENQMMQNF